MYNYLYHYAVQRSDGTISDGVVEVNDPVTTPDDYAHMLYAIAQQEGTEEPYVCLHASVLNAPAFHQTTRLSYLEEENKQLAAKNIALMMEQRIRLMAEESERRYRHKCEELEKQLKELTKKAA